MLLFSIPMGNIYRRALGYLNFRDAILPAKNNTLTGMCTFPIWKT